MSQLLDWVRACIRSRHYSIRTEEAYLCWICEYIIFFNQRHPASFAAPVAWVNGFSVAPDSGPSN